VVADDISGLRWWSASANGLLAFRHYYGRQHQLTWFSRDGRMLGSVGDPGLLSTPRISPDQKTIAFTRNSEQNPDIWTFDLTRNTASRFTFEPDLDEFPVWSSDGKSIVYFSVRASGQVVAERPTNGVGKETISASLTGGNHLVPTAITRDGHWLVLTEATPNTGVILLQSRQDRDKIVRIEERGRERDGSISPDGRWLLYSSIPVARREILVRSVPKEVGGSARAVGKWQISTAGGSQPMWRADGKEIFYVAPDNMMMAVPVESGDSFFRPGAPRPLFQTRLDSDVPDNSDRGRESGQYREYDVTPDGQRFLLNQQVAATTDTPITVIVNWTKLLRK
jgi:Tol biopolymer transport system component